MILCWAVSDRARCGLFCVGFFFLFLLTESSAMITPIECNSDSKRSSNGRFSFDLRRSFVLVVIERSLIISVSSVENANIGFISKLKVKPCVKLPIGHSHGSDVENLLVL